MTSKPAAAKVVHIAAEDVSVRETLRQVLESMDVAIALSHEGTEGLAAVKATQPEVIVLATPAGGQRTRVHRLVQVRRAPGAARGLCPVRQARARVPRDGRGRGGERA